MTREAVFLQGERVVLKFLDPQADFTAYEHWVNDQETTRYMVVGNFPTSAAQLRSYIEECNASKEFLLGIFIDGGERHVGNIKLHRIDQQNQTAETGILVGENDIRGRGIGTEALHLLVAHAFNRLNLNKITAGVIEGNEVSCRIFEKVGFKREGLLREQFYLDGAFRGCLPYGILRSEYKK